MRVSVKRGLLLSLIAVMMIAIMGFVSMEMPSTVSAEQLAVGVPSGTITELQTADDGFYMDKGAGVKVDGSGIKFRAFVTKAFLQENPGDYIAVVSGQEGKGAQAIKFSKQPTFAESAAEDDTFTLNVYVNYDNYIAENSENAEKLANAYATELSASVYVKLEDGSYVKAYSPEGNERAMRSVALGNYLMFQAEDNQDYDYAALEKYFIAGNLSHDVFGGYYLDDDSIRLNGLKDGTYTAYVDGRNFGDVTVTDGVGKFDTATDLFTEVKEEVYVLLFDTTDNEAYTGKVVVYDQLIEVNQANYTTALKRVDYSSQWNHMVLTSDIAMTETWQAFSGDDIKYNFYGLFDGQGCTISNLKFRNANTGLFNGFSGEFKNTIFTGVSLNQGNTGTIASSAHGNVVIDNVFVQVTSNISGGYQGGLIERNNDKDYAFKVDNVYVELPTTGKDSGRYCGYVSGLQAQSLTVGQNVIFVGGYGTYAGANKISRDLYKDPVEVDIALDTIEISDFIKDAFKEVYNLYALNNSNFADLKDATKVDGSEYFYLTEDITLNASDVWTNTLSLTGTFDGRNKTISNLVVGKASGATSPSGLFKNLTGAKIFDVAFVNCQAGKSTGNSQSGLLASNCSTTSYITNVFIDCNVNDAWSSGVVERGCKIVMTNCVVWTDSNNFSWYTRQGIVAGNSGSSAKAVNCYLISNQLKYFMSYQEKLEANTAEDGTVDWAGVENALNYDKSSTFTIYAPDTVNGLTAQQVFVNAVNATDSTVTGLSEQMMTWIAAYME